MKERRGPIGEVVGGIAGSIAQTVRRRQQEREPRVLVYDAKGLPHVLPPGTPERDAIIATAGRLIELASGGASAATETGENTDEDTGPAAAGEEAG